MKENINSLRVMVNLEQGDRNNRQAERNLYTLCELLCVCRERERKSVITSLLRRHERGHVCVCEIEKGTTRKREIECEEA